MRAQLKDWYDGYTFSAAMEHLYNPFSITNAINKKRLENYWIQSGAPSFLVRELKQQYRASEYQLLDPEKFEITSSALGAFDIGSVTLPALMFQAGYLTITSYDQTRDSYHLGYPNHEVRTAAQSYLLAIFTDTNTPEITSIGLQLWTAWNNSDLDDAMLLLRTLFAKVPYPLHIKLESFYHSLLQMICNTAGIKAQSEYNTSHGSIDIVMELPKVTYIVEVKFNASAQVALQQILAKRYYESFLSVGRPIILLGLNFTKTAGKFELTHAYQKLA